MNEKTTPSAPAGRPPLRRELLIAGSAILVGMLIMPLLIYLMGRLTLGPYENGSLLNFFGDFFLALLHISAPAWGVLLGPYALISVLRGGRAFYRRYLI